jgi:hypothetical protein
MREPSESPLSERTHVPPDTMLRWVEEIVARGVRRPGYDADRWVEGYIHDRFCALGLEAVRYEPLECTYWHDRSACLEVAETDAGEAFESFAVPLSEPTTVTGAIEAWDPDDPEAVRGKVALCDVDFMHLPETFPVMRRVADGHDSDSPASAGWAYDPDRTLADRLHRLPFSPAIHDTMQPAIGAGAIGYVGVLLGYPGDCRYYVPYDGRARPIPGVYVAGREATALREAAARHAQVRLEVDADRGTTSTRNVVGELPGADDEWVIVGTHHDAPWASAVEDGTGIALLLAQAEVWASVPRERRPHRLVFVASAAHMSDGAGTRAFIDRHRAMLERTVLEVHLEHAALDAPGAEAPPPGTPVTPRWWFTTEIPMLERAVWNAIRAEGLDRSLLLTPDALGVRPTTDGGFFHDAGVPLVNYLAAPWYLFDPADTLDKVDVRTLGAVDRAAYAIVAATAGVSAAQMRQS